MTKKAIAIILIVITLFTTAGVLAVVLPKNSSTGCSVSLDKQQDKSDNQSILINDLKNNLAVKDEEIRNAVAQIESLTTTKSTLESDLHVKSNLLAEKETALANLQSEYNTKTAEYTTKKAELESQIDNLNNTNFELNENLESLQAEYDSATLEYNTKKAELEAELETLGGQNTELESQLQSLQDEYDTKTAEYNNTKSSLESQISTLETEKESITTSYNALQSEHNAKIAEYETEKTNLNTQISTLTTDKSALQQQYDELNTSIESLTAENETLKSEKEELQQQYNNAVLSLSNVTEIKISDDITELHPYELDLTAYPNITSIDLNNVETLWFTYKDNWPNKLNSIDLKNVTSLITNKTSSDILFADYIYGSNITSMSVGYNDEGWFNFNSKLVDLSKCNEITLTSGKSAFRISSNYVLKLPKLISAVTNGFYISSKYVEIGGATGFNLNYASCSLNFGNTKTLVLKDSMFLIYNGGIKFESTENLRIYVPDELVDTYKSCGESNPSFITSWSTYADYIHPLSELPEGMDTVEYWENLENA